MTWILLGCGTVTPPAAETTATTKLNVVATFSILGDSVQNVGGADIQIRTLVGLVGDIHTYKPAPDDAVALANEAVASVESSEYLPLQIEAQLVLGLVLIRAGRPVEARAPLTEALQRAEAKGVLVLAQQARALLSEAG